MRQATGHHITDIWSPSDWTDRPGSGCAVGQSLAACLVLAARLVTEPSRWPVRIRGGAGSIVTPGRAAEPPGDEGIPIATVEVLDGQHLGAVDECGVRARIYSQATLLEIISCLVSKIDKRLSETPAPEAGGRRDLSNVGGLERSAYVDPSPGKDAPQHARADVQFGPP